MTRRREHSRGRQEKFARPLVPAAAQPMPALLVHSHGSPKVITLPAKAGSFLRASGTPERRHTSAAASRATQTATRYVSARRPDPGRGRIVRTVLSASRFGHNCLDPSGEYHPTERLLRRSRKQPSDATRDPDLTACRSLTGDPPIPFKAILPRPDAKVKHLCKKGAAPQGTACFSWRGNAALIMEPTPLRVERDQCDFEDGYRLDGFPDL